MSWYDLDGDGADLAPIAIRWKDGTPVASIGILGAGPQDWIATPEVEQAAQEEQRILFANVIFLDDFRRKAWVSEDSSNPEEPRPGAA